jgi:hypothetical protein
MKGWNILITKQKNALKVVHWMRPADEWYNCTIKSPTQITTIILK